MADETKQLQGQSEPQSENGDATQTEQSQNFVTAPQLNSAITNRFNSFEKKMLENLTKQFESLKATSPAAPSEVKQESDEAKRLRELEKVVKSQKDELEKERTTKRELNLRSTVADKLVKNGVNPAFAKQATGFLIDSERRFGFDDNGEIVSKDPVLGDSTDVDSFIKDWVKKDDAKIYLNPKNVSGAGTKTVQGSKTATAGGGNDSAQLGKDLLGLYNRR